MNFLQPEFKDNVISAEILIGLLIFAICFYAAYSVYTACRKVGKAIDYKALAEELMTVGRGTPVTVDLSRLSKVQAVAVLKSFTTRLQEAVLACGSMPIVPLSAQDGHEWRAAAKSILGGNLVYDRANGPDWAPFSIEPTPTGVAMRKFSFTNGPDTFALHGVAVEGMRFMKGVLVKVKAFAGVMPFIVDFVLPAGITRLTTIGVFSDALSNNMEFIDDGVRMTYQYSNAVPASENEINVVRYHQIEEMVSLPVLSEDALKWVAKNHNATDDVGLKHGNKGLEILISNQGCVTYLFDSAPAAKVLSFIDGLGPKSHTQFIGMYGLLKTAISDMRDSNWPTKTSQYHLKGNDGTDYAVYTNVPVITLLPSQSDQQ